jgi:glycosyltransferase involved in cell wall biosynthesis
MRILLETSIRRFVSTGLGVYTVNLSRALRAMDGVEILECSIPSWMARAKRSHMQKLFAAYWQVVQAHVVLPLRAKQLQCDVVHYTTAMPLPHRMPCATVATIHDLIPYVHPEWVQPIRGRRMRTGLRLAALRTHHIITDSDATRRDVLRHFQRTEDSVTTVLLAADNQLPEVRGGDAAHLVAAEYGLQPGYILCVGSIEPRKNIERVIEAYHQYLRHSGNATPLVITGGDVWHSQRVHNRIREYSLEKHVLCTGHVATQHLASLFRCAAAFVYPSLYEGFGLPPLEAMRYGCPVITSCTTSLPEVVGDAAILVDPQSVDEIADAMGRVLQDRQCAEDLQRRGYERVKLFSWERCAQETIAVYRKVLAE